MSSNNLVLGEVALEEHLDVLARDERDRLRQPEFMQEVRGAVVHELAGLASARSRVLPGSAEPSR